MHGVREELLDAQSAAIGLPLEKVVVLGTSNEEYKTKMATMLLKYKALGANKVVFGDIFLEDLRDWRDKNLATVGLEGLYPLWKLNTKHLVQEFIALGFKSALCCVNDAYLGEAFVGRDIDMNLLADLPSDVDPCGENGEYHSFVYAGPIFKENLKIIRGEKVFRAMPSMPPPASASSTHDDYHCVPAKLSKGFWFCDLLEAQKI
jgi:uncharacterized protein (TIGR00290 family)